MTGPAPLGIRRLEGIHYYVHDLERSRRFYTGKLDSPRPGGRRRARAADRPALGVLRRRRHPGRVQRADRAGAPGARPRGAVPRQPPRRGRHAQLRGRGRGADVRAARRPRRHADRRHRNVSRRRRYAAPVLDHHAVRRLHVPVPRAPRLPQPVPGGDPGSRGAAIASGSSRSTT